MILLKRKMKKGVLMLHLLEKKGKGLKWYVLVSLSLLLLSSCTTFGPTISDTAELMNISPYNQSLDAGDSVDLFCNTVPVDVGVLSYQWFESLDGTAENGRIIPGATAPVYATDTFTQPGIRYYYCKITNTKDSINTADGKIRAYKFSPIFSVAYTGLPTVYLNTHTATSEITDKEYLENCSFTLVPTDDSIVADDEVEVKGHGNSTWGGKPKQSYNVKLDKKKELLGMAKSKKWVLLANYFDRTLLRNYYVDSLGNTLFTHMPWNPTGKSVDLVLNGEYMGTYLLSEKVKLEKNRVTVQDISDLDEDVNGDGVINLDDGGFLLEVDVRYDEDKYFTTKQGVAVTLSDPDDAEDISDEMFNHIQNIVQTAEDALYSDTFTDEETGYAKYLDVDSVIDWYLINEFTKNVDANFFSSVYMYYDPADKKLHMGPIWDYDISCGNVKLYGCDEPEGYRIQGALWISRLFEDPAFRVNVRARWDELKGSLYQSVNHDIQSDADALEVSQTYNFMRLPILGTYIYPTPKGYLRRTTYQSEVDHLIHWLNIRYKWLDKNLPTE